MKKLPTLIKVNGHLYRRAANPAAYEYQYKDFDTYIAEVIDRAMAAISAIRDADSEVAYLREILEEFAPFVLPQLKQELSDKELEGTIGDTERELQQITKIIEQASASAENAYRQSSAASNSSDNVLSFLHMI